MIKRKKQYKDLLNDRYVKAVEEIMGKGEAKTIKQKDLSQRLEEYPNVFSDLLNKKKNVSLPQIVRLVNEFGLNANYFIQEDNSKEQLQYNLSLHTTNNRTYGDINVKNNTVSGGTGFIQGDVYNVDNLIQNAHPEVKKHLSDLEKENSKMKSDLKDFKKNTSILEKSLKDANEQMKIKDERLFQVQQELIQVYRDANKNYV